MYPTSEVATFIADHFIPVKIHVKEQPATFERFGAPWTPTQIILDPAGEERYRIEGFLPTYDFLAQLELGLGHSAFKRGEWDEAQQWFQQVVDDHPDADAAPEAQYWLGVSRYKKSGDAAELAQTAKRMDEKYPDTVWAKKASVWRG